MSEHSIEALREKLKRLEREALSLTASRKTTELELADLMVGRDGFRARLADATFEASKPSVDWRTVALDLVEWLDDVLDGRPTFGAGGSVTKAVAVGVVVGRRRVKDVPAYTIRGINDDLL